MTPFIAGADLVTLVIDERAATHCGHKRAILAIGGFTLIDDPGADGGQGCLHRVSAVSRAAVPVAHRETSPECRAAT
jgi:hypothetical protein